MTPAELLAREAREWLAKAWDDLGSARVMAAAGRDANALFHCQQAGEKPGDPYVVEAAELEAMMTLASRVLAEIQSRLPAAARVG